MFPSRTQVGRGSTATRGERSANSRASLPCTARPLRRPGGRSSWCPPRPYRASVRRPAGDWRSRTPPRARRDRARPPAGPRGGRSASPYRQRSSPLITRSCKPEKARLGRNRLKFVAKRRPAPGMLRLVLRVAFAGTFAASLAEPVRARVAIPCDLIVAGEREIVSRLADVDVLVTLAFTREMGGAARRIRLVQVPGAGLDRIDRAALPRGTWLANAYGHEVGIAEYVLGAILTLTRGFAPLDAALRRGEWKSQWAVGVPSPPPWPELAGKTLGILGHGRIGQGLARRARAFDMTVLGIRRDASQPDPTGVLVRGP